MLSSSLSLPSFFLITVFGHNGFFLILKGSVKPFRHETIKEDQAASTVENDTTWLSVLKFKLAFCFT